MSTNVKLKTPSFLIFILLVICTSCSGDKDFDYQITPQLNPHRIAPLSAILNITSKTPCRASIKILGASPIEQTFEQLSDSLYIPVLGLYANTLNQVEVTLDFGSKTVVDTVKIQTHPLPDVFPRIEINKLDRSKMEQGLHGCDIHFANYGKFRSIPLIFDDQGKVRWYLDLSFHGKMVSPFQRLNDGTILMVGRFDIYEFDMLGKLLKQTKIDNNYGMHHEVLELPNGDLIICVGKRNAYIELDGETVQSDSDFMIHYSRKTGKIIKEWDLAKHLDVSRNDLNFFRKGDWIHMNGLAFSQKDSTIIVSGKNQGIIKVSWDDNLQWIMSPKKNWGKSGRKGTGFDTKPYLLTAIDSNKNKLDNSIQEGINSQDNFDFPWGPHAPELLSNGNLLVFDNGVYRNFKKDLTYSRAVEYNIGENHKTIEQVWQYGKERGVDFFSSIVSDVDALENGNLLITSGYIAPATNHSGKIVEIDYPSKNEVFEATLYFKTLNGNKTKAGWGQTDILYRSERISLYD